VKNISSYAIMKDGVAMRELILSLNGEIVGSTLF